MDRGPDVELVDYLNEKGYQYYTLDDPTMSTPNTTGCTTSW